METSFGNCKVLCKRKIFKKKIVTFISSKSFACSFSLDPNVHTVEFKTPLCWSIYPSSRKRRVPSIFDKLWKMPYTPDKETLFTARNWSILLTPQYTTGCCCRLHSLATQTGMSPKSHTHNVSTRLKYRKANSLGKGQALLPLIRALFTMRQPGLQNPAWKTWKPNRPDLMWRTRGVSVHTVGVMARTIKGVVGSLIPLLTKAHQWRMS